MQFEFGDFVLDESRYELRRGGTSVRVDKKVFALLAYMLRRPGQLVTREELIEHVWDGRTLSETVLTGAISRVRKALGDDDRLVVNVHGVGYRFTGQVRAPKSLPPAPALQGPFVGRDAALGMVMACMSEARAGRGSLVVVAGEPGIGKTQLAEVAAELADKDGVPSAWGHCPALETCPPFWPVIQLLRGALRHASSEATRAALEGALALLEPEESSPAGTSTWSAAAAHRKFDGITSALRALSDERPWLMIIDDLQWADAASLGFLAYMAPEIAHIRVVLLLTARNTEPQSDDPRLAHVLGHRNCRRIELQRLTSDDVAEYVTLRLGKPASDVSRAVYARSEGNPFFMRELLRPFSGAVVPRAEELSLPGPALDIVRQRIRILGQETVDLLSAAAVIGRDFDLGLLAHVTDRDPQVVQESLGAARRTSVILSRGEAAGHFTFGHDLIRSVLLEGLSPGEGARLHLRAAEALQRRYPVGDAAPRAELAHHLLSALPLGDLYRAIAVAKSCAVSAANACALADAATLFRRALAALELASDPDPRVRCDLLLNLSRCERASADNRFSTHLMEAATLGREHGFGEVLAEAGRYMSFAPGFTSLEGAREVLEAADRMLPPESAATRADVLAHLAWTVPNCFDRALADTLIARAEGLATESGDSDAMAIALSAKLYFANGPDSPVLAQSIANRVEALYAESPALVRIHWSAQVEFSRIVTSLQRGDMEAVERAMSAFGVAARRLEHAELEWHHQRARAIHRMNRGEFQGMKSSLQELQERAEQLQLFSLEAVRAVDWGVLLRETEGPDALLRYTGTIVLRESDCPYRFARKIRSLVEVGAAERARAALDGLSAESLERLPHDRDYLATLTHLTVASVATRKLELGEMLYKLLSPYPHLHGADLSFHCDGSVSHFLGILSRALGRTRDTVRHLEEALEHNESAGLAPSAAHSAYELAITLLDSGGSDHVRRARTLLSRARDASLRMGMTPLWQSASERLVVS